MKIGKGTELLKKAASTCKNKTSVLAAKLLVLVSLRRRMATVGAFSHRIHALVAAADRENGARVDCNKALMVRKVRKMPALHGGEIVVNISHQLALFDQGNDGDGGCTDWTLHPIFNDDDNNCCYTDECEVDDNEEDGDEGIDDQPSVMDVIRNHREAEGLEFSIDGEIDQAADMFITRFRKRMNQSF
ncbi:hypothetical protein CFC21_078489 [Triticum aestivum]|uniref:Uncharacterized protein n=4 Tax=Triticinae TaxID=1648030 RepID=A0A453L9M9_AEGTS|nr:uncharacterized protein LOC123125137 [Triticum aestivum]KAF7073523.1 hypothetical protein CFC21_078489 [Triticum aestivum]